jgi:hypothetical protein
MTPDDFIALRQAAILLASCLMVGSSVWAAGRLAPIVLGKKFQPENFRQYFFKDDGDVSQGGYVMLMLSAAVLLTMLLAVTVTAKLMGWHYA